MIREPLTPREADGLLDAYALDAIDHGDRERMDDYLTTRPERRTEVELRRRAAAVLLSPTGPRPEVWERIAAQVAADEVGPGRVAPVVALDGRRRSPRRLPRIIAVAAALCALAGTAVALTLDDHDTPTDPRAEVREAVAAALHASGAQVGTVRATDGAGSVEVVVLPSRRGYVTSIDLPRATANAGKVVYRLYALTARGPVPVATLTGRLLPVAFELPVGTTGLAVATAPPAIGADEPSTTPASGNTSSPSTSPGSTTGSGAVPVPSPAGLPELTGLIPPLTAPTLTVPSLTLPTLPH